MTDKINTEKNIHPHSELDLPLYADIKLSDEDVFDLEELVDIDEEDFNIKYADITAEMIKEKSWYLLDGLFKGSGNIDYKNTSFKKVETPKHLGLGRSTFYDKFLEDMTSIYNHKVYQSDYMVWINPSDSYASLLFYINTADKIDFSLEGVSLEDIEQSIKPGRLAEDRHDHGSRYMTLWEINQIIYSDNLQKTKWHIRDNMKKDKVYKYFGGKVEIENILVDSVIGDN